MRHLVTVALLTYNRANYLKESLAAVVSQTYENLEILVCDNASTDATAQVIQSFNDPRIVHIRQSVNKGVDGNYREAAKRASGNFVLITHDDDVMESTLVERQVAILKHDTLCVGVASNVSVIDSGGRVLQERLLPLSQDRLFKKGDYIKAWVHSQLTLPVTTFMYRVAHGKRGGTGFINPNGQHNDLGVYGDIFCMCSTNLHGRLYLISDPLLRYRQHGQQDSFADDIVRGGILLHKRLVKLCNKRMPKLSPLVEGCLLRYSALDEIVRCPSPLQDPAELLPIIGTLDAAWKKTKLTPSARVLSSLSFEMLKTYAEIDDPAVAQVQHAGYLTTTDDYFVAWLTLRRKTGFRVCESLKLPNKSRFAILGSVFNAYLLGLDCVQSGHEVVVFMDSNRVRQGHRMGDRSVVPPDWLRDHASEIDVILLSSERDRAVSLTEFLKQYLPTGWQGTIVGWRDSVRVAIDSISSLGDGERL